MTDIHLETVLPVSPQAAYGLFTYPNLLEQWLCNTAHLELRVGGAYFFSWVNGWWCVGKYTVVEPNERLAMSWLFEGDPSATQADIRFTAEGDGTRITVHHTGYDAPGWTDEARAGHLDGWQSGLNDLAKLVETGLDARMMRRPLMGVHFDPLTPELAAKLHCPVTHGLMLSGVVEGSGADNAGLKANDVIVNMDGIGITHFHSLGAVIQQHQAGNTIAVEFYRGQDKHTVQLTFGQRPMPPIAPSQAALVAQMREAIKTASEALDAVLDGTTDAELMVNPAPDEWNVKQILAHCIWAERMGAFNIWEVASGGIAVIWTGNQPYQIAGILATHPTGAELAAELKRAMNELPAMVEALDATVLSNPPLFKQLALFNSDLGDHVHEHIVQIKAALAFARQAVPA